MPDFPMPATVMTIAVPTLALAKVPVAEPVVIEQASPCDNPLRTRQSLNSAGLLQW